MESREKIRIIQSPSLTEVYLKESPEIFKENDFELAEYALVNGHTEVFTLIFEHFYPEILKIFEYGFKRDFTEILDYDEYARKHADYLKCFLPPKIRKRVYDDNV